jgi:hypothetical protein
MSSLVVTTVTAARAMANDWLVSHLPDRFAAGVPEYDQSAQGWRIPVWLSYPQLDPLGPIGELVVDEATGERQTWTIVGPTEADLMSGKLSAESPVAKALLDHGAGDAVEVQTPRGTRRLRIERVL